MTRILAFETSCDDTAVAIIDGEGRVLGEAVFSQLMHGVYGGVVPEIGSRAHIEQIWHVSEATFKQAGLKPDDISHVAATFAPGLIGPLLVGAQFAKGFSLASNLPLIAVHHIEGHIFSGFGDREFLPLPFIALIVSGGHSALYRCDEDMSIELLGETLDDAAGEAFDKVGRALGLGYPAGKLIDELAAGGDEDRFSFPIAMQKADHVNFSFSGLKTKAMELIAQAAPFDEKTLKDFCAGLQKAIATALCEKSLKALKNSGLNSLVLGGGVAANGKLRALMSEHCQAQGISLYLPPPRYCTDNAVMIGRAALLKVKMNRSSHHSIDVMATMPIERAALLTPLSPQGERE